MAVENANMNIYYLLNRLKSLALPILTYNKNINYDFEFHNKPSPRYQETQCHASRPLKKTRLEG